MNTILFFQLAQKHREFYVDKSGTLKKVNHFMIPTKAEDQIKRNVPL